MLRMLRLRRCGVALVMTLAVAGSGCSDQTVPPIDQATAIKKASGGDGQAKRSAKARENDDAAAKSHPKLH